MGVGTPGDEPRPEDVRAFLARLKIDPEALAKLSDAERAALQEQLAIVERALKENPLLGYLPHAKQVGFHEGPWPRSRLFIGGNRSGKTTATLVDTMVQCVDRECLPEHLVPYKRWEPPFFCRVVGPDLTRWLEGVALQKFREWCPRPQLRGGGFAHGWDKQQVMLRFANGSSVQFMSNDQDLDKFAGAALHRVVYDESPRQDIRRECLMRLIDYGGEELFGLTPTEGLSNWLYDDFYAPWERLTAEGSSERDIEALLEARLVLVDMDDNPHLAAEDKRWALSGLDELSREARKTGRFVTLEGLIYPMFSKSRHVVPVDEIPAGAECFEGIDPGLRHPAVVFCFLDQDDRLVVYDELMLPGQTIRDVVKAIRAKRERWGVEPRWSVIDPASRNKAPQTGRSDQQEFWDNGVTTLPGQNDWRPGVNRVRERLEADPPRLLIASRCEGLREEFKKYRFAKSRVRSDNDPREQPVKKDDHLLDALRYVCMQRPMAPLREVVKPTDSWRDRALRELLKRLNVPNLPDNGFGPGQWA